MNYKSTLLAVMFATMPAQAADIYIDQAGDQATIDITQSGGYNRIGSDLEPSVIDGNNVDIDIVQSGDLNTADIKLDLGADDTVINYSAVGSTNLFDLQIFGGIGNQALVDITGDSNSVTMCQDLLCANEILVNDVSIGLNINGSRNTVNFALDSADAVNTVNIGNNAISDDNTVNIAQGGIQTLNPHVLNLNIDGFSNTIIIDQQ